MLIQVAGADNKYIKIALEHIAAMLVICSAVVDFFAIKGKRQQLLNMKVALYFLTTIYGRELIEELIKQNLRSHLQCP